MIVKACAIPVFYFSLSFKIKELGSNGIQTGESQEDIRVGICFLEKQEKICFIFTIKMIF